MSIGKITVRMLWVAAVIVMTTSLAAMASETVTIQGEINDNFQIVDSNGQVYEIADTDTGNELAENHIGDKAKVTGTVAQDNDVKVITIITFEALAE